MENEIISLEAQIHVLGEKLSITPEKFGVKYNPSYFALKNKIKNLRTKLSALQHGANKKNSWQDYLAK